MLIKVCGITEQNQLDQISEFVDMTGMIFYPKSPRFLTKYIEGNTSKRVGVFVNETEGAIRKIADEHKLDVIQLHGSESPELCAALKRLNAPCFKRMGNVLATASTSCVMWILVFGNGPNLPVSPSSDC